MIVEVNRGVGDYVLKEVVETGDVKSTATIDLLKTSWKICRLMKNTKTESK
jgi:hypothetical protein